MPSYYMSEDLARFGEMSKTSPHLFDLLGTSILLRVFPLPTDLCHRALELGADLFQRRLRPT